MESNEQNKSLWLSTSHFPEKNANVKQGKAEFQPELLMFSVSQSFKHHFYKNLKRDGSSF